MKENFMDDVPGAQAIPRALQQIAGINKNFQEEYPEPIFTTSIHEKQKLINKFFDDNSYKIHNIKEDQRFSISKTELETVLLPILLDAKKKADNWSAERDSLIRILEKITYISDDPELIWAANSVLEIRCKELEIENHLKIQFIEDDEDSYNDKITEALAAL